LFTAQGQGQTRSIKQVKPAEGSTHPSIDPPGHGHRPINTTMKFTTSLAATVLLAAAHAVADPVAAPQSTPSVALKALVYSGCYSSGEGLTLNQTYIYQSKGHCQPLCVLANQAVLATANSTDCYCGDQLPPASSKVDDSFCNDPCSGYDLEMCGGINYFSVYLSGTDPSVGSASASSTSSGTPSPTAAKPSVVTIGGQTVVVTATNSATNTAKSSGGPSKAGIAAGVVVGIVAIGAIAGGAFFFVRHRRRRQVEEEYRRNAAVSSFMNSKPPTSSGAGSLTDTRLDPAVMAQRRMSDGSIADNQDYSRRILKVTNA